MTRALLLAQGRRAAEAGMVDTCTIRRPVDSAPDPYTGVITPTHDSTPIYDGKCRVQQENVQAQEQNVGQDYLLMVRLQVQIPMSVTGVEPGDVIAISASRDLDLVGRTFVVRDLAHKTDATARRIGVIERTS